MSGSPQGLPILWPLSASRLVLLPFTLPLLRADVLEFVNLCGENSSETADACPAMRPPALLSEEIKWERATKLRHSKGGTCSARTLVGSVRASFSHLHTRVLRGGIRTRDLSLLGAGERN